MLWKCCTQYASESGKLSSGHRIGTSQFSFQFWKEYSNYSTIALISHTSKVMLNILQASLQQYSTWTVNSQMFKLDLEKAKEPEIQHSFDTEKAREFQKKHLLLLYWSTQTVENSERGGNTWPPDPPVEKPICRSRSNSYNWTWTNRLVPNRKRSTSRLYIVTLLI